MKVVRVCLALALAALAGGLAFMYAGLADVGATSPHWAVTRWVLATAMERSVERHARGVTPPPYLDEADHLREGASGYEAMCASCHGAPGEDPGVVGMGLNPEPPRLAKQAGRFRPEELFWLISNGVRMTGMPGFGATHSPEELWDLVAVVRRLPHMSPAEYHALAAEGEGHEAHHHHEHSHGH